MSAGPASDSAHQGGRQAARGQSLRQRRTTSVAERARHQARCAEQIESKAAFQLRPKILQATTPHRERLRPPQGLPPHLHSIRPAGSQFPRLGLPRRCYRMVDLMSLDPSMLANPTRLDSKQAWGRPGNAACPVEPERSDIGEAVPGEERRHTLAIGQIQPGKSKGRVPCKFGTCRPMSATQATGQCQADRR